MSKGSLAKVHTHKQRLSNYCCLIRFRGSLPNQIRLAQPPGQAGSCSPSLTTTESHQESLKLIEHVSEHPDPLYGTAGLA